jgi:uncharacterized protein (DUF2267 family)
MSSAGVEVFDSTLQKTSQWLNDLMMDMGWQDRQMAYSTLRAVLHTLRDRLTADEAVDLGAQLPMLIRGFYEDFTMKAGGGGRRMNHRIKRRGLPTLGGKGMCFLLI